MSSDLDGPNDQPVVIDDRLFNCAKSQDGFHHPHRSRDGQRCSDCGAWIRGTYARPVMVLPDGHLGGVGGE